MKTVVLFPDPSVMLKFQGLGEGKRITPPCFAAGGNLPYST